MFGEVTLPREPPSVLGMFDWLPPAVPLLPAVAIGLSVWYLLALRRVRSQGRQWSWVRTTSFLSGCVVLAAVTGLAVDSYGYRLFSAFMFQHLTLSILVPPLLVLGAPGRLLLRSTPHRGFGRHVLVAALAGLRCRASRVLVHHGFTIPVFLLTVISRIAWVNASGFPGWSIGVALGGALVEWLVWTLGLGTLALTWMRRQGPAPSVPTSHAPIDPPTPPVPVEA